MFTVRCPAHLLWHPNVHHSLLLLRSLRQRHTLLLDPTNMAHQPTAAAVSLLYEGFPLIHTTLPSTTTTTSSTTAAEGKTVPSPPLQKVYSPEHILHFFNPALRPTKDSNTSKEEEMWRAAVEKIAREMEEYLSTCLVTNHLLSAVDSLLLSLGAQEPESIRHSHAQLMDLIERVEHSFEQEDGERLRQELTSPSEADIALSTWPLYAVLRFLIEQGGLLTSAFPNIRQVVELLQTKNKMVLQHHQFIQKTVAATATSSSGDTSVFMYPNFLRDVQRVLRQYNTSVREQVNQGVTGDRGAPSSRYANMGLQSVPARLPWTQQGRHLTPRN